jgi:hypothetical protein
MGKVNANLALYLSLQLLERKYANAAGLRTATERNMIRRASHQRVGIRRQEIGKLNGFGLKRDF